MDTEIQEFYDDIVHNISKFDYSITPGMKFISITSIDKYGWTNYSVLFLLKDREINYIKYISLLLDKINLKIDVIGVQEMFDLRNNIFKILLYFYK